MYTLRRPHITCLLIATFLLLSFQGQPAYAQTCDWVPVGSDIYYICGKVGIGTSNPEQRLHVAAGHLIVPDGNTGLGLKNPGERLHVGDGNILLEGGGETALKFKRDFVITGTSGISRNPIFEMGRIIQAGDGDPEFRFLYSDDTTPPRAVLEFDRKGIVASVKQGLGSHFEGFISSTATEPIFRLNSYKKMRLEMGDGTNPVDVAMQREGANTLTFRTNIITPTFEGIERLRVDSSGVEIRNGYFKLPMVSTSPPAGDCDSADEVGRIAMHNSGRILYICTSERWGRVGVGDRYTLLSTIHR